MRSYATKPEAQFKRTVCGTNSPPLEATGEEKPMGRASVDREYDAGFIYDCEQRKGAPEDLVCNPFQAALRMFRVLQSISKKRQVGRKEI